MREHTGSGRVAGHFVVVAKSCGGRFTEKRNREGRKSQTRMFMVMLTAG